jgi:hypothetical protein
VSIGVEQSVHRPFTHEVPAGHTMPHPPQLLRSVSNSKHWSSEPHRPHWKFPVHTPLVHVWPPTQAMHPGPQCSGSVCVFAQAPPQLVVPVGQRHMPPEQTALLGQRMPHPPQLLGSFATAAHRADAPVPQSIMPMGQTHTPDELQNEPVGQTIPQPPQFAAAGVPTIGVSQPGMLSQFAKPAVHEYVHATPLQPGIAFAADGHGEHAEPHVAMSAFETQLPPQRCVPLVQVNPHVVPSHVGTAFGGTGHGAQSLPHEKTLVSSSQTRPQKWNPVRQSTVHMPA